MYAMEAGGEGEKDRVGDGDLPPLTVSVGEEGVEGEGKGEGDTLRMGEGEAMREVATGVGVRVVEKERVTERVRVGDRDTVEEGERELARDGLTVGVEGGEVTRGVRVRESVTVGHGVRDLLGEVQGVGEREAVREVE